MFANVLKASQLVLLFEGAVDHIPDSRTSTTGGPVGRGLRYDGPGTNLSGNSELAAVTRSSPTPGTSRVRAFPTPHLVWLRRRRAPGILRT